MLGAVALMVLQALWETEYELSESQDESYHCICALP